MNKPKVEISIIWAKDLKCIRASVVTGNITATYEEYTSAEALNSSLINMMVLVFRTHGHNVDVVIEDHTIPNNYN